MGASFCARRPLRNESNFLLDRYTERPGSSTRSRTCATTAQTSGYQNDACSNKTDERLSDLEISHPDEKEAALAFGAHAPGGQRPLVQTLVPVVEKRSSRSLRCIVARFRTRARYRTVSQSSLPVLFCCAQTPPLIWPRPRASPYCARVIRKGGAGHFGYDLSLRGAAGLNLHLASDQSRLTDYNLEKDSALTPGPGRDARTADQ